MSDSLGDDETVAEIPLEAPATVRPTTADNEAATPLIEIVRDGLAIVANRASGKELPLKTPWAGVNEHMRGGMWPGLYTLTGNTGSGKTQWAMQVALAAAKESVAPDARDARPVVYIALELGKLDIAARMLGLLSGMPHWKIAYPGPDGYGEVIEAVAKHQDELNTLPILVRIAPPLGWSYLGISRLAVLHKPKLMVLDYAQLVSAPPGAREDVRTTVGNVAKICRDVARTHNATVVALCSTARANYAKVDGTETDGKGNKVGIALGKGDPSRLVGLGKESGELEYTADCALVLGHEPKAEGERSSTRKSWLAIAKGRGYGTGWVSLRFDGSQFFEEGEGAIVDANHANTRRR